MRVGERGTKVVREVAGCVRNVKERYTYVVKPGLDRFVRHRFARRTFLSSTITYPLRSLPLQRDESQLSFFASRERPAI